MTSHQSQVQKHGNQCALSSHSRCLQGQANFENCLGPQRTAGTPALKERKEKLLDRFGLISSLPVAHGSIGWFHNKSLLPTFPAQLLDIVLELGVLGGEDPGFGYEAVLLRLALNHSTGTRHTREHRQHLRTKFIT